MSFRTLLTAGVAAVSLTALFAGGASAATISTINETWTGTVGGSGVVLNQSNPPFLDVRWGISTGSGKSGLGFDDASTPINVNPGDTFLLGTLRHYNNPIQGGSAASSAALSLSVLVAGAVPATQTFSYNFLIDETVNAPPCAYPSTTPCADKITFQNLSGSSSFNIGGQDYTMSIVGFSDTVGGPVTDNFISQEGASNDAFLYAKLTTPTRVPEPLSIALFGTALFGLGLVARRRAA